MIVSSVASAACLMTSLVPLAVLSAPNGGRSESGLITIVISPEWRELDLQRAPSTVNVLSARQLDEAGVADMKELQYSVPGMVVRASGGAGEAVLRGVGSTLSAAGDSGVATFTDGIYRNSAVHTLQGLYDVERIEVIKGPHGVHLGRNVMGGAIGVVTRDPEPYASVDADLTYGSYEQREFRGAVNLPISDAGLSLRLAGNVRQREGYAKNVVLGTELDDLDYAGWRGKLRYRPSSDLDIVLMAETTRRHDSAGLAQQPDPDIGINTGILLGGRVADDPRVLTHNIAQSQDSRSDLYGLRFTRRGHDLEFRSLTSYQNADLRTAQDLDGTDIDVAASYPTLDSRAFSQEFRLGTQPDLPLAWTAGVYFLREDSAQHTDLRLPLYALRAVSESTTANTAYALFGDLSGLLAPNLRLRGGLRYSQENREIDLVQTLDDPLGIQGAPGRSMVSQNDEQNWDSLTPEFSLLYTPHSNAFVYAKVSRGFKSGGFNAYVAQPSFDPEYLWAYEAGMKLTLPGAKLRLNMALFHYDYTDMQIFTLLPGSPSGTLPVIDNAAKASIRGLDLELWHYPTANLEMHASATVLDARFDEFHSVDPNNPGASPDHAGQPLPNAPDLSLVFGSSYQWHLANGDRLKLSSAYRHQSSIYFNAYHDPAVRQDAYGLLNASLSLESAEGDWHLEAFGENLTDELYATNKIRLDPLVGTARHWGAPRTIGLRAGWRF